MNDQKRLDDFVALSSALTGVAAEQLKPDIDPIGIAGQYLAVVKKDHAAALDKVLAALTQQLSSGKTPAAAAAALLADATFGPLCRSIISMWLLGTWYDPAKAEAGAMDAAQNVVSSQAYKESLIWKVMQSHPMGYSMFQFGYWSEQPPPLSEFISPASEAESHG